LESISPTNFRISSYLVGGFELEGPVPIVLKARKDPATSIIMSIGSLFIFKRYLIVPDIVQN
jgi:hypothetical protein